MVEKKETEGTSGIEVFETLRFDLLREKTKLQKFITDAQILEDFEPEDQILFYDIFSAFHYKREEYYEPEISLKRLKIQKEIDEARKNFDKKKKKLEKNDVNKRYINELEELKKKSINDIKGGLDKLKYVKKPEYTGKRIKLFRRLTGDQLNWKESTFNDKFVNRVSR